MRTLQDKNRQYGDARLLPLRSQTLLRHLLIMEAVADGAASRKQFHD